MKKIYLKEVRHIVANYLLSNKATGYRINSKSIVTKIICDMINRNWIECKNIDGQFMYVYPSVKLTTVFAPVGITNKECAVQVLKTDLLWNNLSHNSKCRPVEIAAT